jgi:outer membrane protein assembly factor BamB
MALRPLMIVALALGALFDHGLTAADQLDGSPPLNARNPSGLVSHRPDERWRYSASAWGTPALDRGHVYFMTRHGEVLSLDARTGKQRWRHRIGPANETPLGSRMVVSGDVVAVGDYDIVGLDHDNGREKWRFRPADGYGAGVYLGDARDGRLFSGSPSGRLYAVDAASGKRLWALAVAPGARATVFAPVVDADLVIAGFSVFAERTTGGVIAADARTGGLRWRLSFPASAAVPGNSGWAGGPATFNDSVFAAAANGSVYQIARSTGTIRSVIAQGHGRQPDFRAMARAGSRLILGSLTGDVIAFGIADHKIRWRANGDMGSVGFSLAADRDDVYVPHLGGRLAAIGTRDGRERWRTTHEQGTFSWVPTSDGTSVFAAGTDSLTAFVR